MKGVHAFMIFVNYKYHSKEQLGVLTSDEHVISLEDIYETLVLNSVPKDMNELINQFDDSLLLKISDILDKNNLSHTPLDHIEIKTPIPFPRRNIICLGKNYADHAKEIKGFSNTHSDIPKDPIYFTKSAYPCIGTNNIILRHENATHEIDYEVELAIVIGKKGINIKAEDVESYIFGYTIANDISSRDLQKKHYNWFKGKSLDSHCAIGPWIVHKSKLSFPVELDIQCWVNDELRQDSNTRHLIFDIPHIISDLSKGMTLIPGDIILTGTPAGVGLGYTPPNYLKSGDVIKCTIENIGTLTNYIER